MPSRSTGAKDPCGLEVVGGLGFGKLVERLEQTADSCPLKKSIQTEVSTSTATRLGASRAKLIEVALPAGLAAKREQLPTLQCPGEFDQRSIDRRLPGPEGPQADHLLQQLVIDMGLHESKDTRSCTSIRSYRVHSPSGRANALTGMARRLRGVRAAARSSGRRSSGRLSRAPGFG